MVKLEAMLLVWGVRDEILRRLPVEGYWLYGEYDFIARVEFRDESEMEAFERELRHIIHGGTFKLIPIELSAVKDGEGGRISILEDVKALAL